MQFNRLAAMAAALLIVTSQAQAGGASVNLTDFLIQAIDLSGSPNPTPAVTFSGTDSADTEITIYPPGSPYGGPPGWDAYNGGLLHGNSAFDAVVTLSDINYGSTVIGAADAYFDPTDKHGEAAARGDGSSIFAELLLGGQFDLSANTELVVYGTIDAQANDGLGYARFGFLGSSPWEVYAGGDTTLHTFSLVFRNDTNAAVTGTFSGVLFATSVPEPASAALLLAGALGILSMNRRRQARD